MLNIIKVLYMTKNTEFQSIDIGDILRYAKPYLSDLEANLKKDIIKTLKSEYSDCIIRLNDFHVTTLKFSNKILAGAINKICGGATLNDFSESDRGELINGVLSTVMIYANKLVNVLTGNIEITINNHLMELLRNTSLDNLIDLDVKHLGMHLPFKSFRLTSATSFGKMYGRDVYTIIINNTIAKEEDGMDYRNLTITGMNDVLLTELDSSNTNNFTVNLTQNFKSYIPEIINEEAIHTVLNILLYMSNYTDLTAYNTDVPVEIKPVKFNSKLNIFTGTKTRCMELGYRIGAKLSAYYQEHDKTHTIGSTPTGRTVIPHIKRAHWAKYYVGPRKDKFGNIIPLDQRQSVQRLKAPIFVNFNLNSELDMITTVRELK